MRFTFVIPVLNESSNIGSTLRHLNSKFPNSETIVVDGGSVDGTREIAEKNCDLYLDSTSGRAVQMNLGASLAKGEYLIFLHADTKPSFTESQLEEEISASTLWGFCGVVLSGERFLYRVIAWSMSKRSNFTSVASGDQMIFVRRAVFIALGGYKEIPLMEDINLSKRLRAISKPQVLAYKVITSSRRWERHGAFRTVFLMWILRLAFSFGVSPHFIKRFY